MTNQEMKELAARAEAEGNRFVEEAILVAPDPVAAAPLLTAAMAMYAIVGAANHRANLLANPTEDVEDGT